MKNYLSKDYFDLTKQLIRKMRTTCLMILVFASSLFASNVNSQVAKVSITMKNAYIIEVIQAIESQTDYLFVYDKNEIDLTRRVDLVAENKSVSAILNGLFSNTDVVYAMEGNNIMLMQRSETQPQQKSISGKVTDSTDAGLPGVSVVVKGTTNGTITDGNGNYSLPNIPGNATLQFSFVGMKTQEIEIGSKTTIVVSLEEEAIGIDEVVAVGYGTQKKINLTGAVGAVNGEILVVNPATNVVSSLQGRLPGVTITQSGGEPGKENVSILIRGLGTMNNASPMVIVDGLESQMSAISPYDIESVSVLKDAAAAAIYGSRGANGVILVTTKRGKSGFSEITYNTSHSWQKPTNLPQRLGSVQYAQLYNEGLRNEGLPPVYSDADISKFQSGSEPYNFPNTDWIGLLLTESGLTQNHNLTFSGGNEKTNFRASFGYFDQNGLMVKSGRNRYNSRINVDSKIRDWFNLAFNSSITRDDVTSPSSPYNSGTEFFRQVNIIPPTISNKNADGTWNSYTGINPIAWLADGGKKTSNSTLFSGSTVGELKLMKGLTLKGIAGVDFVLSDFKDHQTQVNYGNGTFNGPTSVNDQIGRGLTTTLQSLLNYNIQLKKHGVNVLLGASRESYSGSTNGAFRSTFPSRLLDQLDAGSTTGWKNSGNGSESRIGSYFGRINYDYNGKYLLEANLRRDASSKFASDNRVGLFPSMSAGWRMSEEGFMKNIKWIDNLKFRASYGQLGNNSIGDYMYIQRITLGQNYDFAGVTYDGASTTVASNNFITWEETTELNIGVDMDLFHNKLLSVSADYYNRYTDKILAYVPVSMVFGLDAPLTNAGAMSNKGVELLVEHRNKIGGLQYGISVNAAYNKNNVEKYENPSKGDQIYEEGSPWGSFYGLQEIGIYQTDAEANASPHISGINVRAGDLIYKDINDDGKIDGEDRVVLGNNLPEFTFGTNLNLQYHGFDASAFFQGAAKVSRVIGRESFWPFDPTNLTKMHLDRTIVENGQVVSMGHYPRTAVKEKGNRVQSSFTVLDATYLRLKNIQLGYTLPPSLMRTLKIVSRARIYISGQNLLTFTRFPKGYDPELGNSWTYSYPQVKFYTFGFDVTF